MRSDQTAAEHILWQELRARRLAGFKFRRQVPVGPFIADFLCHERRLAVEVDGDSHDDPVKDRQRDMWFLANGWFVLRFTDTDVFQNLDGTVDTILLALTDPGDVVDPLGLDP